MTQKRLEPFASLVQVIVLEDIKLCLRSCVLNRGFFFGVVLEEVVNLNLMA